MGGNVVINIFDVFKKGGRIKNVFADT